jgi:hypothetical protein
LFNNRCNRDYVLRVLPTVTVNIHTGEGNIAVTGVDGAIMLHSSQGDVVVRGGRRQRPGNQ